MPDERLPQRTLAMVFWLTVLLVLIALCYRLNGVAYGLAVGGGIGMLSLWSLMVSVRRLLTPRKAGSRIWLSLVTFLKLPVYATILSLAMASEHIHKFSVFAGAALVPCVLVLKVLGYQLAQPKSVSRAGEDSCRTKPIPSK